MPVARPTIATDVVAPAEAASAQAAVDTICGYIDDANDGIAANAAAISAHTTAIGSNTDSITTLLARLESELNLLKHKLRQAGVK